MEKQVLTKLEAVRLELEPLEQVNTIPSKKILFNFNSLLNCIYLYSYITITSYNLRSMNLTFINFLLLNYFSV